MLASPSRGSGTGHADFPNMARDNHGEVTALYRALLEQAKRQIADGNLDAAIMTLRDAVAFSPERDHSADRMLRGVLAML